MELEEISILGLKTFCQIGHNVKVNGNFIKPVKVRQLWPVLFLIYINDVPDIIAAIMKLFADDPKVYRSISTTEHIHQVQFSVDQSDVSRNLGNVF